MDIGGPSDFCPTLSCENRTSWWCDYYCCYCYLDGAARGACHVTGPSKLTPKKMVSCQNQDDRLVEKYLNETFIEAGGGRPQNIREIQKRRATCHSIQNMHLEAFSSVRITLPPKNDIPWSYLTNEANLNHENKYPQRHNLGTRIATYNQPPIRIAENETCRKERSKMKSNNNCI